MPFWLAKVKICFDTSFLLFRNVLTIHICGSQTSRFIYQAIVHSSSVTAKWAGVEAFDPPPHFAWWEVHFAIMKTVFLQNSIKQNINHKSERSSHGVPICAYCCTGKKKKMNPSNCCLCFLNFSGRAHTFLGWFWFWGVTSEEHQRLWSEPHPSGQCGHALGLVLSLKSWKPSLLETTVLKQKHH